MDDLANFKGVYHLLKTMGLLKNAHLLCCAANRTAQRISIYASRFGYLRALHLNIFEQPPNIRFLKNRTIIDFDGQYFLDIQSSASYTPSR
jgi:hypothetical protein